MIPTTTNLHSTLLSILSTENSPKIKRSFSNLWPIALRGDCNSEQRWIHPNWGAGGHAGHPGSGAEEAWEACRFEG